MKSLLAKLFFGGLPTDDWLVVAAVQDDSVKALLWESLQPQEAGKLTFLK